MQNLYFFFLYDQFKIFIICLVNFYGVGFIDLNVVENVPGEGLYTTSLLAKFCPVHI